MKRNAGDRAPDASVLDAGGRLTRLFDLFRGTHWTLLGYEVERETVQLRQDLHIHIFGATGDVIDDRGQFQDAYDLTAGEWVLVRPDGYIAAIVSDTDVEMLEAYLGYSRTTRGKAGIKIIVTSGG